MTVEAYYQSKNGYIDRKNNPMTFNTAVEEA